MATYTRSLILILLIGFSAILNGQTAEKTLLKSFNTGGLDRLIFELPGQAEVKVWENPTIRIQLNLALPNSNVGTLDELIRVGRYNLVSSTANGVFTVNSPNMGGKITIKGQELKEQVSFVVFVPKNTTVKVNGTEIVGDATAYIRPPADHKE